MITTLVFLCVFGGGLLTGAIGVVLLWGHLMKRPGYALGQLAQWWRQAHPHWCQISEDDDRKACPCCGWSEERRNLASDPVALARRTREPSP